MNLPPNRAILSRPKYNQVEIDKPEIAKQSQKVPYQATSPTEKLRLANDSQGIGSGRRPRTNCLNWMSFFLLYYYVKELRG